MEDTETEIRETASRLCTEWLAGLDFEPIDPAEAERVARQILRDTGSVDRAYRAWRYAISN